MTLPKLFFYFFKFFGLVPVNLKIKFLKDQETHDVSFVRSNKYPLYTVLLTVLIAILNYYNIVFSYKMYRMDKTAKIDQIIDTIRIILGAVGTSIILIKYCVQSDIVLKSINDIMATGESLFLMDSKTIFISFNIKMICFMNVSTWSLLLYMSETHGKYIYYVSYLAKYNVELIISCTIVQCSVVLKIFEEFFQRINEELSRTSEKFLAVDDIYYTNSRSELQSDLDKVSFLHKLHLSHCEVLEKISGFYTLPMLLCVTYVFMSLTIYSYYSAKSFILGVSYLMFPYFYPASQVIHNIVLLIILAQSVTYVIKEVKNFLTTVTFHLKF